MERFVTILHYQTCDGPEAERVDTNADDRVVRR